MTTKKDIILGHAQSKGIDRRKLQKLSGLSPSTFDRRMKRPDTITIGELRRLDGLAHFPDQVLIDLVRRTK